MGSNSKEDERKFLGDGWSFKGDLKDLNVFPNGGNGNDTKVREQWLPWAVEVNQCDYNKGGGGGWAVF